MNEIKLDPVRSSYIMVYVFICLDVIGGNYLAITADCWCEKKNVSTIITMTVVTTGKTSTLRRFSQ